MHLNTIENPFGILKNSRAKRCIYIAPQDVATNRVCGGTIEAITDAYYLSSVFAEVLLVYPKYSSYKGNEYLEKVLNDAPNISLLPVEKNSDLISLILLSSKRISYIDFLSKYLPNPDDTIIVGCHRNFLIQLKLFYKFPSCNLYFKSYGSIYTHNIASIYAVLITGFIDKLFLKRLFSSIFYGMFEYISFLFCKKIFFLRDPKNIDNTMFGKILLRFFKHKAIFKASGPFWYFLEQANLDQFSSRSKPSPPLTIGCIGDNTYPTSVLGLKEVIKSLAKANDSIDFRINLFIAGKYNKSVELFFKRIARNTNLTIKFLGYIDDKEHFFSLLDGLIVPVAGGSGTPIKALEALSFNGPVLTTNYVRKSCGELLHKHPSIFYKPKEFIESLPSFEKNK